MDASRLGCTLLARIYGSGGSVDAWPEVLDHCVTHVGARSATLLTFDRIPPRDFDISASSRVFRDVGEQAMRHYTVELAHHERTAHQEVLERPARTVFLDHETWPDETALRARADYAFLEKHYGIGHKMMARLNDNPRWFESLAFQFPAALPRVPQMSVPAMRELLPHVAKAVETTMVFARLERRYAAVLGVLDRVGVGLCVLESRGRVLVANAEAQRILEAGHGIDLTRERRLHCSEHGATARLDEAIARATIGNAAAHTRAETVLAIRRLPATEPVIIEVVPLRDRLGELGGSFDGVLVQLVDTSSRHFCRIDGFALAHDLSGAESAVAALAVEGLTNVEMAESRGVSPNTVKTQLASVMSKSRARSRVELIRKILKTVPPIDVSDRQLDASSDPSGESV